MCAKEIKKEIYRLFDEGLEPTQVIVKLNIPHEKRTVSGCYTYYKMKKQEEEKINKEKYAKEISNKYKTLIQEKEKFDGILNKQIELLNTIAAATNELANLTQDINIMDCNRQEIQYSTLRQYLLHMVEHNDYISEKDILEKIKLISKIRRGVKLIKYVNENTNTIKGNVKNVNTMVNAILQKYEKATTVDVDRFIGNRDYKLDEVGRQILHELNS